MLISGLKGLIVLCTTQSFSSLQNKTRDASKLVMEIQLYIRNWKPLGVIIAYYTLNFYLGVSKGLITGAPNDGFLPNALKRCFRLSGVLLKLCRLILGCAIKFLSVRFF